MNRDKDILAKKIGFTMEDLEKCLCPTCPVQADSTCSKENLMKMHRMMKNIEIPESDVVPGVYCASGKTGCSDLDFDQTCQCNYCGNGKKKDLENGKIMGFFCRDGKDR